MIVNIPVEELGVILGLMSNTDYICVAAETKDGEGSDWYYIYKLDDPRLDHINPIYVMHYLGPNEPVPATTPRAFRNTKFQLSAALLARNLMHNGRVAIDEEDYMKYCMKYC